jgi:hypothetical protein
MHPSCGSRNSHGTPLIIIRSRSVNLGFHAKSITACGTVREPGFSWVSQAFEPEFFGCRDGKPGLKRTQCLRRSLKPYYGLLNDHVHGKPDDPFERAARVWRPGSRGGLRPWLRSVAPTGLGRRMGVACSTISQPRYREPPKGAAGCSQGREPLVTVFDDIPTAVSRAPEGGGRL